MEVWRYEYGRNLLFCAFARRDLLIEYQWDLVESNSFLNRCCIIQNCSLLCLPFVHYTISYLLFLIKDRLGFVLLLQFL